tara:strand:- start:555 stop:2069 length:1515 start_codon:yes stop_codon:yes gene_type:complete
MRNLYSEDISKFTETKGCPSNNGKPYLDVQTNSIDMNKWNQDDPNTYIDLTANLTPCNSLFFTDSDTQGCCYSTNNYNDENSMGLKLDFSGVKYNVFNKYDVQNIFNNNLLDDPNKLMKFFKLIFVSIITLIITALIGSCYEFWLKYGESMDCLYYKSKCFNVGREKKNNQISLVDYLFPNSICYYPYQKCDYNTTLQGGGVTEKTDTFVSNYIEYLKNGKTKCITINHEVDYTYRRPFPYNIADMAENNIEGDLLKMPFKAFAFFFLITMLLTRKVLNPLFKTLSVGYQKYVRNNAVLNNIVFLLLSGILLTIIGYYTNNSTLASGPMLWLTLIVGLISFVASFGMIASIIFVIFPKIFISKTNCNLDPNYYKLLNNKLLYPVKKELSMKEIIVNILKNIFMVLFFIPIAFIISLLTGVTGSIAAMIYANFIIPLKIIFIPFFNSLEFFDIIKGHADLLTILFCVGVIGSSSESLDKTTTGIMSLILVIIIIYKAVTGLKNSI